MILFKFLFYGVFRVQKHSLHDEGYKKPPKIQDMKVKYYNKV